MRSGKSGESAGSGGLLWRAVGAGLAALLLAVLVEVLRRRWQELPEGLLMPDWTRLATAVCLLVLSTAVSALQWRRVIGALGGALSASEAIAIHCLAQAGKYVPGKLLLVVGKVVLAVRQGLSLHLVTASVVYDQALFLLSGALVALILAGFAALDVIDRHRAAMLLTSAAGLAVLHPVVMTWILRLVQRLSRGEMQEPALSYLATLRLLAGYLVPWLVTGAAFYLFAAAFAPLSPRYSPDLAAVAVLSGILGLVSVFAPAGLGVREAALAALLSAYYPLPVGIAISLAFRVAVTFVDVVALCGAFALRPHRRGLGSAIRGSAVRGGAQPSYSERYADAMYDSELRRQKARKAMAVLRDHADRTGQTLSDLSLLEIGCSTGYLADECGAHFRQVVGIDVDAGAVEHARHRFSADNVCFRVEDATQTSFADASFDAVTCSHIYEHVVDPQRLVNEIHRLLKPGGFCYFAAGNRLALMEPHYRLPLLSVLPRPLSHPYLRVTGKADRYEERQLSVWGLRRLVRDFQIVDYTRRIIEDPAAFRATEMLVSGGVRQRLAMLVVDWAYWLCPTYIWVLVRPP